MSPPSLGADNTDNSAQGSWREWARHVLLELERLNTSTATVAQQIQDYRTDVEHKMNLTRQEIQSSISGNRDAFSKDVNDLKVELAMLKVKAGMWGAVGSAIPILVTIMVALLVHYVTAKKGP